MSTPQLSVRLPLHLNQQLNKYIKCTGISKTDVVTNALAHYLECVEDTSLTQRVAHLEAKIASIEALIKGK